LEYEDNYFMGLTKLKIGVILDSTVIPSWSYQILNKILDGDYISSIKFFVLTESTTISRSKSFSHIFYRYYMALEKWKFKPKPSAFELCDITSLPNNNNSIHTIDSLNHPIEKSLEGLKKHHYDIIINLSTYNIPNLIYAIPKYGIWQYSFADQEMNSGEPPAFWELFENQSLIGCSLRVVYDKNGKGVVVSKIIASVEPISVIRNHNANLWRSAALLPREIKKMCGMGPDIYFQKNIKDIDQPKFYTSRNYAVPTNTTFLKAFLKRLWNYLKFKYSQIVWFEQWVLMYNIGESPCTDLNEFQFIIPPKDRFWADPFCILENDKYYVFFEEALNANPEHAHICALEIEKTGIIGKPQVALQRDYHLSYPYIFRYQDKIWMIPETADNHTVELYECLEFPDKWELHTILINDIVAYDATLLFHNNTWWLFATVVESPGASTWDEVFLFYADSPTSSSWTSHPKNPIVSDVQNARPAGKIFTYNGDLYRPAQNSSKRYGYGMNINKILNLTKTEYKEKNINKLEPNFNRRVIALHTLNFENDLTVIDVQRRRQKFL